MDAICNQGYTYTFFLRYEGVPKEYTPIGLSPLHAHLCSLFLTIHNKFHEVRLNNIYTSANFAHLYYTHQNCVKVQGGGYKNEGRGIPRE